MRSRASCSAAHRRPRRRGLRAGQQRRRWLRRRARAARCRRRRDRRTSRPRATRSRATRRRTSRSSSARAASCARSRRRRQLAELGAAIAGAALVVDALFGIGPRAADRGPPRRRRRRDERRAPELAVDTAVGPRHRHRPRCSARASTPIATVTMAALKIGLVSAPGFACCGDVERRRYRRPARRGRDARPCAPGCVEESDVASWLPSAACSITRARAGTSLVIGGTPGMRGAGRLAAVAALRAGAGLVTLAAPGDVTRRDSVMTKAARRPSSARCSTGKAAIVIGPGSDSPSEPRGWVARGARDRRAGRARCRRAEPHRGRRSSRDRGRRGPGRDHAASRRGGAPARHDDRRGRARSARRRAHARGEVTHAVVVLKGARTIVCDGTLGDEYCAINPTGGPALATGGSGDVLAGAIGALLAQGLRGGRCGARRRIRPRRSPATARASRMARVG